MYNERTERFTVRDVILQVLFVALFIFLLVWLFPSKSFVNKKVDPLLDTIFNTNIMTMKDAAKDYFTISRLPQKVGDIKKLTLKEMLDNKLLLEFSDKYGKSCSVEDSYVEITKMDDEYVMKVNLKCSEQEDYILVHMGCYDYCSTTICEKKDDTPVAPNKPITPDKPKPTIEYEYQYKKVIKDSCTWGNWSDWTEKEITANDNTEVKTKTEVETKTEQVLKGYKKITYLDKNSPIKETRKLFDGYEYKTECTNWKTEYEHTGIYKYGDWTFSGYVKLSSRPKDTDTVRYSYDATQTATCDECSAGVYNIYRVEKRSSYEVVNKKDVCTNWEEKKVAKYKTVEVIIGYEEKVKYEPVYETVTKEITKTLYQSRTKTCVAGTTLEKWSSLNDQSLLSQGYVMTGAKREK